MKRHPLKLAIVGAGRWGSLHASKVAALPGLEVAVVVDTNRERASRLASKHRGALSARRLKGFGGVVDGAIIAVPVHALHSVSLEAIAESIPILVEKPMARSCFEAESICLAAARNEVAVRVGFVERFNQAAQSFIPSHLGTRLVRWGPAGPRGAELALDWAIHDLDLAAWLHGGPLEIENIRVAEHAFLMRAHCGEYPVEIDCRSAAGHKRRVIENEHGVWDLLAGAGDPLSVELAAFAESLLKNERGCVALATGEDALNALRSLSAA